MNLHQRQKPVRRAAGDDLELPCILKLFERRREIPPVLICEYIARFEKKIQATLARVWGEEEPSPAEA